jgi:hypothetical protein
MFRHLNYNKEIKLIFRRMSTRVVVLREADLRMPFSVVLSKWYMGVIHLVIQDADPPSRKRGGSGSDVPWDEFSALHARLSYASG